MSRQVTFAAYEVLDSLVALIGKVHEAKKDELKGVEKQVMDQTLEKVLSFKYKMEDLYSLLIRTYGDPMEGLNESKPQY